MDTSILVILVCVIVPVGIGIMLLRAHRPQAGDEPRCGNCNYNLTGSASNRCPECGMLFIEAGVLKGRMRTRPRRWLALVLIVFVPMVGVITMSMLVASRAITARERAAMAQAQAAAAAQQARAQAVSQFMQTALDATTQPAEEDEY